jgi:hypothetical protein
VCFKGLALFSYVQANAVKQNVASAEIKTKINSKSTYNDYIYYDHIYVEKLWIKGFGKRRFIWFI